MIAEYSRKSLLLGIPGIVLQMGCYYLLNRLIIFPQNPNTVPHAGIGIYLELGMLAGNVLFIIGLCYYAKAKGYTAVLGLLGLFSCLGLLVLAVLPDRTKNRQQ